MQDAGHPDAIVLEQYAMNNLSEEESELVEDHIALCAPCLNKVDEAAAFVKDFRHVAAIKPQAVRAQAFLPKWLNWRNPAWVGAVAVALLLFAAIRLKPLGPVALVTLGATRGTSTIARGTGPFEFEMFMPETAPTYHVLMVDANGRKVWESDVPADAGKLRAVVREKLAPGQYFIRVSIPLSQAIHEYGVLLER